MAIEEDMVTFVAAMVKEDGGVAADAFGIENTTRNANNATMKRDVLQSFMGDSFQRSLLMVPCD